MTKDEIIQDLQRQLKIVTDNCNTLMIMSNAAIKEKNVYQQKLDEIKATIER